jgi:hypothetical protein
MKIGLDIFPLQRCDVNRDAPRCNSIDGFARFADLYDPAADPFYDLSCIFIRTLLDGDIDIQGHFSHQEIPDRPPDQVGPRALRDQIGDSSDLDVFTLFQMMLLWEINCDKVRDINLISF